MHFKSKAKTNIQVKTGTNCSIGLRIILSCFFSYFWSPRHEHMTKFEFLSIFRIQWAYTTPFHLHWNPWAAEDKRGLFGKFVNIRGAVFSYLFTSKGLIPHMHVMLAVVTGSLRLWIVYLELNSSWLSPMNLTMKLALTRPKKSCFFGTQKQQQRERNQINLFETNLDKARCLLKIPHFDS